MLSAFDQPKPEAAQGDDNAPKQGSLSRKSFHRRSKRASAGSAYALSSDQMKEPPSEHHAALELLPVHAFEDICRHIIRIDRGSVVHLARGSPGLYVPAISALMRNVGHSVPMFRVKSDMVWPCSTTSR
ncbi:hypothetical protein AMAG_10285 [Allomyces macrogynus ATCC 38327]|uniref:Uncharacterized protein n=1 Tax=Allomyces macrogynus (strain ATCC 38327) TaxID=578462 RepID=A0A0L0STZ2_ALLM3|nr:hypothetical protein AMAG_10285 [Allomyces macrogynus ATCC 38327]|eukprot:KNE66008.1 hypothetical protein AMAG_10285 [Allomyces macrogynus ATCC 38327]